MKDIIRIHLAKIPYEIEAAAKVQLQNYLDELRRVNSDDELGFDVEVRMTEILRERGTLSGGVVTEADVAAIVAQLGAPQEFGESGETTHESTATTNSELDRPAKRALYRDTDTRLVGGVLAGLSARFGVSVIWWRLATVVLTAVTGGATIPVYLVLWLVVPPTVSSTDRLRMTGRPVTVASLAALGDEAETEAARREQARRQRRLLATGAGLIVALIAAGVAAFTVITGFTLAGTVLPRLDGSIVWQARLALGLAIAAGALLVVLLGLITSSFLTGRVGRGLLVSAFIVSLAGLASFGGAVASTFYAEREQSRAIEANTRTVALPVPENFANTTRLEANLNVHATYVVSSERRIELTYVSRTGNGQPAVKTTVTDQTLTLETSARTGQQVCEFGCREPEVKIYGPALTALDVRSGRLTYMPAEQPALTITGANDSWTELDGGTVQTLNATLGRSAGLAASSTGITSAALTLTDYSDVSLGNVRDLAITHPETCARNAAARLDLAALTRDKFTINGRESGTNVSSACLELTVDDLND